MLRTAFTALLCSSVLGCTSSPGTPTTPPDGGSASDDGPTFPCALGFLGDSSKPIEIKLVARGADEHSTEIADGAKVALILPPQGGRVIFVGVKATNISPCNLKLTGSFRDKSNQQVRLDARTVNLAATGDGWGGTTDTDISSFSNVPMCPNQWATSDIFDNPFELTLSIEEPGGRKATKTITATPTCAEPQYLAECLCQCKKGYVLGQKC